MPGRSIPFLFLGLLACVQVLSAQGPPRVLAAIDARPGAGSETLNPAPLSQNALAITADGKLWALVAWTRNDGQSPPTTLAGELRLFVSNDRGSSWSLAGRARTLWASMGALGVDPDGETLHLAWPGRDGAATHDSIYYGTFDTASLQWKGSDQVVFAAVGASDYYNTPCLVVTSGGLVVVSGTRYPSAYQYSYLKVFDGRSWSQEAKWGTGAAWASVRPQMVLGDDDRVHLVYAGGGYATYYRSFDPAALAFGPQASFGTGCYHNGLGVTPGGEVFVLHSSSGALRLLHSRSATAPSFTAYEVGRDALFTNTGPTFYCCRVGVSGNRVTLYYALPSSKDRILAKEWTGSGLGLERTVYLAPANSEIDRLAGMANGFAGQGDLFTFRVQIFDGASPPALLLTRIMALSEQGAVVRFGRGCPAGGGLEPRLNASEVPFPGNGTFALGLDGAPPSAAALALLGTSRSSWGGLPLPMDLTPLGLVGCRLHASILLGLPSVVDGSGRASFALAVPARPELAGAGLYAQWVVAAAGAPGGLCLSGGGALRL